LSFLASIQILPRKNNRLRYSSDVRNRNIDYFYIENPQEIKSGFHLPHISINTDIFYKRIYEFFVDAHQICSFNKSVSEDFLSESIFCRPYSKADTGKNPSHHRCYRYTISFCLLNNHSKTLQKVVKVEIVLEYLVSLNTPRDYMVQCPRSIYSRLSWHKSYIIIKNTSIEIVDLKGVPKSH